ncbi:MAG: hypothetical protein GX085_05300 [Firmicutes bacterium]|nr:hypothetical protein [Bacillota bacterium]
MEVWQREKGSTVLLAILILAVGSALVLSLAQTKQNSVSAVVAQERSAKAFDLAESGLETVCQQARAHILNGKKLEEFSADEEPVVFGGGDYTVKTEVSSGKLRIKSRGRYEGVTRVVQEEVEVKIAPPDFDDNWVIATKDTIDTKYLVPGNYYYAEKKLTLNHNYGNPKGEIFVGTGPGGKVHGNAGNHGWTITELKNPPKPQEITVEYFKKSYSKTEIEKRGFKYYGTDQNWDGLPKGLENKMIFINGNLMINKKDIILEGNFKSLTIIATGNLHLNGDVKAVLNNPDATLNLIAGGNLHINGGIEAGSETAQIFLYSEKDIHINSSVGRLVGRLRAKGTVHVNNKCDLYAAPMNLNIPGVLIDGQGGSGGGGDNGSAQTVFTVVSWQEIDPGQF